MQQVADFMIDIGLDMYAKMFRELRVDGEVLCDLDHAVLHELGVKTLHRKKILRRVLAAKSSTVIAESRGGSPPRFSGGVLSPRTLSEIPAQPEPAFIPCMLPGADC